MQNTRNWQYVQEGVGAWAVVEPDGTNVAHLVALRNSAAERNLESTAKLFASAPELVQALHEIRLCVGNSASTGREILEIARRAIVKATGNEP